MRHCRLILAAATGLVLRSGWATAQLPAQGSVTLTAFTSGSFRWMDVAGNLYAAAYRAAYNYTQATVVVA